MENDRRVLEFGKKCVRFGRTERKVCRTLIPIQLLAFLAAHFVFGGGFDTFIESFAFGSFLAPGGHVIVVWIYLNFFMWLINLAGILYGMKMVGIGQVAVNTSEALLRMDAPKIEISETKKEE